MIGIIEYTWSVNKDALVYRHRMPKPARLCPFCRRKAHAKACVELRALLMDPPDEPPTIDQEGDIDRP